MDNVITPFTLTDISLISVGGDLSEPLTVRLGELPRYFRLAEQSGQAVLILADGKDQTDILEFLENHYPDQ